MTIRRRLARSNLVMILIPVAIAAVLLLLGGGLALLLLERVWLPRLGLSFAALHETGEQLETAFAGAKALAAIYAGTVILALLAAVAFTHFYLTRSLFRHISAPLQTLVAGVERIRGGDLAIRPRMNSSPRATRWTPWPRGSKPRSTRRAASSSGRS